MVKWSKVKGKVKQCALIGLAIISFTSAVYGVSNATSAYATASQTLSTKESLNSPVLNNQFTQDNWNPWEMVCWGVFLSNFCQIGVDDYESAFSTTANYGSMGAGYAALKFSTGSDATNDETIKNLLDYAVNTRQKSGTKPIFIGMDESGNKSRIADGKPVKVSIANYDSSNYTKATIKDIFPNDITIETDKAAYIRDYVKSGTLNTFYVDNDGLIEVWDLLDSWDIQIMGALIGKLSTSPYADQTLESFKWAYDNNAPLLWDCFGNICYQDANGRIVVLIPASCNQHLTIEPKINLMTSLVMNGGTGTNSYNSDTLLTYATMDNFDFKFFRDRGSWGSFDNANNGEAGHNPVGLSVGNGIDGKCILYYDTDSIYWMNTDSSDTYDGDKYGEYLGALFSCDGNATTGSNYPLKLAVIGGGTITDKITDTYRDNKGAFGALCLANMSSTIADQCASVSTKDQEVLSYYRDFSDTHKIDLFGDEAVYIPVSIGPGYNKDGEETYTLIARQFVNYLGQRYNGKFNENTCSEMTLDEYRDEIHKIWESAHGSSHPNYNAMSNKKFRELIIANTNTVRPIMKDFIWANTNLFKIEGDIKHMKDNDLKEGTNWLTRAGQSINILNSNSALSSLNRGYSIANSLGGNKLSIEKKEKSGNGNWLERQGTYLWGTNEGTFPGRVIKTWGQSDVMNAICNYLNLTDGTDFSASASFIYLSYIDYYELVSNTDEYGDKSKSSAFNDKLFNWAPEAIPETIDDLVNAVSQEDMEKDILRLAYLSLAQNEEGRNYRNQMMMDSISSFVYEQYCRIVYGTSGVESAVTSKSNASFLRVHTLDENFLTSFVLEKYAEIAVWLLGFLVIFTVIIGALRGKKLSWYLITTCAVISSVLFLPSVGDLLPYASNKAIQSMFKDKMTFWSMSELITNYTVESDFMKKSGSKSYSDSLDREEIQTVMSVIDSLDSLQLDRSLMVKQDISNKMICVGADTANKLQQFQSTRWILPLVMQQYGNDEETPDKIYSYVYVNLSDTINDASNVYWYYYPNGKTGVKTVAALSDWGSNNSFFTRNNFEKLNTLKGYNKNIGNTAVSPATISEISSVNAENDKTSYRCYTFWKPNAQAESNMVNRYYYIANNNTTLNNVTIESISDLTTSLGDTWDGFQSDECIEAVVEKHSAQKNNMENTLEYIERYADSYSRNDGKTVRGIYGFLDATESPLTYFYTTIQSYFSYDASYAYIVKSLEGGFDKPYNDDGTQIEDADADLRVSMLNQLKTGYTVDVLNLEDMFRYMIPYMYEMTIVSGGVDGKSGLLEDKTISEELTTYEGTDASWLFRCNWAIKIIENPDYCKDVEIGLANGDRVTIKNAALPSEYTRAGREMVFSEAQQKKMGLRDEDLSLCELECIKINKDVAKKWTYLLNYVGTEGINREILIRQMAIDANLIFNSNISSPSIVNTKFEMFPSSLDLRTISFDSIMKMLCLNMTQDTSYLYGDTMKILIEDSDLVTSLLLLLCAFLCCYVVGLVRDFVIALILYSSIIHILHNIASSNRQKVKVTMGTLVSTIVVTVATVVYYWVLHIMVSLTSTEEVLNSSTVTMRTGNPVWLFLVVIVVTCIYIFGILYFCLKILKYAPQEIAEIAASLSADVRDKTTSSLRKVRDSVTGMDNRMDSSISNMSDRLSDSIRETGEKDNKLYKNSSVAYDEQYRRMNEDVLEMDNNSNLGKREKQNISDINSEIEKGKASIPEIKDSGNKE